MRIVIDEAGDLPAELIKQHNIHTVPINIMFGTEQFLSNVDIDHATFYHRTDRVEAHDFPKTAQPSPYQFEQCFRRLLAEGAEEILAIVVSQKLSGTYASAIQASNELAKLGTFHIFDSQAGSAVQGFMAIEAARMHHGGESTRAIIARLEQMRDEAVVVLMIESLEYAVKGGRVSSLRSMMASLLSIKPILLVEEGIFVEAGRVRSRNRALGRIIELTHERIGSRPTRLAVIHANSADKAKQLQLLANSRLTVAEEIFMEMSIPVAINLGPGSMGLVAIPQ